MIMSVMFSIAISSCNKDAVANWKTLKKLYKTYENGEISECKHNGQVVYRGALSATDAGEEIYNIDGKQIGNCDYAWGNADQICRELTDCEVFYRSEDNIWGRPAIDIYSLGK